ncbi:MAG: transglutaminase family protein [Ilumatobacteraceae bacterium]
MSSLDVAAELSYDVQRTTSFAFSIVAARTTHQSVESESIEINPPVDHELVTYGGGSHQLVRLAADAGRLDVRYRATVTVDAEIHDTTSLPEVPFGRLPAELLPFLNPSRYCESDKLADFAWRHFGHVAAGYERLQSISNWVNQSLLYQPGSTDASSSTTDVLLQRAGVCRDYAHVGIALCRALGIPARYVSGYGVGVEPQDFHGFFEAYVGDDWYLFDPTGMTVAAGLVRIGYGRDAADAAFATLVGDAQLTQKIVSVTVNGALDDERGAASTA